MAMVDPTPTPIRVATTGGRAAWSPRIMPSSGPELTTQQKLAAAFRILAADGFSENIAGHITVRQEASEALWVNPWGLWWDEVKASDVCLVSSSAEVLEGKWDVTPAIHIHTELHRARPDAAVVIHNHPYYCTVLAALGILPEIFHQTGCMFEAELAFVDEYTGEIASPELGSDLAARIGSKSVIVLANHGVVVTAPTIEEATYKAASFDRQCRLAYDVTIGAALGLTSRTVPEITRLPMKSSLIERAAEVFWNGWVRKLVREQSDFLS